MGMYDEMHKKLQRDARSDPRQGGLHPEARVIFQSVTCIDWPAAVKPGWLVVYDRHLNGETVEKHVAWVAHAGIEIIWDNLIWASSEALVRATKWDDA